MKLRLLLAFTMLVPTLPADAAWECPFKTIEGCRAWLEKCCGAGDRVEELCGITACESSVECEDTCAPLMCCPAESAENKHSIGIAGDPCCSDESSNGELETRMISQGPERVCSRHSASGKLTIICEWCCCCPIRPIRVPEPQQTLVTQRSSVEKIKAERIAADDLHTTNPAPAAHGWRVPVRIPLPSETRLAVLCVWLK